MNIKHKLNVMGPDGRPVEVLIFLEIDDRKIAYSMGSKALRNKSQRSKLAIGITAEVRRVQ